MLECRRCGTCCTAPDISTLGKKEGERCKHLNEENLCAMYDSRPDVCRNYTPDDICKLIQAPLLEERVALYLKLFN